VNVNDKNNGFELESALLDLFYELGRFEYSQESVEKENNLILNNNSFNVNIL
jgi:hypothetical protein